MDGFDVTKLKLRRFDFEEGDPDTDTSDTDVALITERHRQMNWLVPPDLKMALSELYGNTDKTIRTLQPMIRWVTQKTVQRLQNTIKSVAKALRRVDILDENITRSLIVHTKEEPDAEILLAVLHRLNCLTLRFISGASPCVEKCCCHCDNAYREIPCNGLFLDAVRRTSKRWRDPRNKN